MSVDRTRAGQPPLIVHVVYQFGVGGLENGIVNVINRMPASQWRHAVVSLTDVTPEIAERIERSDVEFVALDKGPGHLVGLYPRLLRIFRALGPAVVHTRNLAPLEAVVPAWAARVPVRVHGEHGWSIQDTEGRRRRYQLVRRAYRPFVTRYVALSRQLEHYLVQQVGIPSTRISRILNGVDTSRFAPSPGVRVPIPGCPFPRAETDTWIVGTVGRMEAVKDPLSLARAFVRALELAPTLATRLRLVIVGAGPLSQEVASYLDRAALKGRVWLAGERGDVAEVMRGLDCFVLPSRAEGTSNTILEAMATGLPVIATQVGGNAELIESGMTGTLVPAGSPETLARAIADYAADRATARRHAKAARRVAETRFSIDRMVSDYASMYRLALTEAGVTVPRDGIAAPAAAR
jgi:sugar transferase (PEP-CTERM/EpsH1 system associated)